MKKSWMFIVGMMISAAMVVAWDFVQAQNSTRHVVRVRGADSVAGRVDRLAKIFMKNHEDFFVIVSGGSKAMGLDGLMDRTCEVAMAPRKVTDGERREASAKGVDLMERLIGYGAIAMVVNATNPVSELTVEQVQKILKGAFTRWNELGGPDEPIELFAPGETHAGTLFFIRNDLLGGASLASSTQNVGSFENVLRRVGTTKGGFGFTRVRDALESPVAEDLEFKVVAIKQNADSPAVKLARKTVADGAYPIKRPFFLYLDRKASPQVKEFVDFVVDKGWGPQRVE